jgi:hypothetical protein
MKNIAVLLILFTFFSSCRKDKSNNALYKIDIENAYSIALSKKSSGIKSNDSMALFKITIEDKLSEVTLYNSDIIALTGIYTPTAIYNLNKDYFLLALKITGSAQKVTNCYLVNKTDGLCTELKSPVYPKKYTDGNWEIDYSMDVIKSPNENTFMVPDENSITKLTLKEGSETGITSYSTSSLKYETDTAGNILNENVLTYTNGETAEISSITDSTIIAHRYENGFYLVDRTTEKISISQLTVSNGTYEINLKKEFIIDASEWSYQGNATLPFFNAVLPVFDKGILLIKDDVQKIILPSAFGLESFQSFYHSHDYLYAIGLSLVKEELQETLIKINANEIPPTFATLFTPNYYHFYSIQVNNNNSLSFYAKRNSDSREVIGYSSSLYINILQNDQNLKPIQFVTLK